MDERERVRRIASRRLARLMRAGDRCVKRIDGAAAVYARELLTELECVMAGEIMAAFTRPVRRMDG